MTEEKGFHPWPRVAILVAGLLATALISRRITGQFLPSDPNASLIFQNALLLIVLGSALLEQKFTKPAEAAINGLMGMITLIPVFNLPNRWLWSGVFTYCACVFVFAMTCVAVSSGPSVSGLQRRIAEVAYRPAVLFGKARVLYSVVFLYAVFSFYGVQSKNTALLEGV